MKLGDIGNSSSPPPKRKLSKSEGFSADELFDLADAAVEEATEANEQQRAWVITFGDLMSLLLVFFVMLFAMSELKVEKFQQMASSMHQSFGGGMDDPKMMPLDSLALDSTRTGSAEQQVEDYLKYIEKLLKSFVAQHELENTLQVTADVSGVTLRIQDLVLFDEASAELKPEARGIIDKLGDIVNHIAVPVIVAGHTDAKPISTDRYPSNWELSGARASTLARIFIEKGFDPEGIHIEGYAANRPVADNDTPEGRAKNRRVELLYTRQNVLETLMHEGADSLAMAGSDSLEDVTSPR